MRIHVYLSTPIEKILNELVALDHVEHPGTTPKPSGIISDALITYAGERLVRHLKDFGCPPKTKAKLEALARALDEQS